MNLLFLFWKLGLRYGPIVDIWLIEIGLLFYNMTIFWTKWLKMRKINFKTLKLQTALTLNKHLPKFQFPQKQHVCATLKM